VVHKLLEIWNEEGHELQGLTWKGWESREANEKVNIKNCECHIDLVKFIGVKRRMSCRGLHEKVSSQEVHEVHEMHVLQGLIRKGLD
jgi:hypothetical protein